MNRPYRLLTTVVLACIGVLPGAGCRSMYYSAWEQVGVQKRHILRDRVEHARDMEMAAVMQFASTLQRVRELTGYQGGDVETMYRQLNAEYNACYREACGVKTRVSAVRDVAEDLFTEWAAEIETMSSPRLRAMSRQRLDDTRARFATMYAAMKRTEKSMLPVLAQLRDQVLFLKHNLNAAGVGSLRIEADEIERDIGILIQAANQAIQEANTFVVTLPQ